MCGFVALFAAGDGAAPPSPEELRAVRDRMAARGPDGSGEWFAPDGRVALGHRRLAVIDPSPAGAQPMVAEGGAAAIVFNGEIYNHAELRRGLESAGERFVSRSDTEVLLRLYLREGEGMFARLRGMYALAIWDARRRRLLLARDPYGIKPLYYSAAGGRVAAASQVKALLLARGVDASPAPAGHAGFFLWGHLPEPHTLHRGIRSVAAGACVSFDGEGRMSEVRHAAVPEVMARAAEAPRAGAAGRREELREALRDSVRAHLVADVPVGLFLSAGIDSAVVAALAAEAGGSIRSVTLGFEEYRGTPQDEAPLAEELARRLGLRHETVRVRRREFEEDRERLLSAMDQPSIDGANTYFVSKAAAAVGMKVALSGLGGDELFGGYPSFRQVPRSVRLLAPLRPFPGLGRAARALAGPLLSRLTSPKYASLLELGTSWGGAYLLRRALYLPWELPRQLDAAAVEEGLRELATLERLAATEAPLADGWGKVMALESCWYMRNQLLRDTDWASMAHSLEVRVPLVDLALTRRIRALGAGGEPVRKGEVARALGDALPAATGTRRKTGFSFPIRAWYLESAGALPERGLRGWAHLVRDAAGPTPGPAGARGRGAEIVALLTDGYGARGGIAQYSRDLLVTLCERPGSGQVVAFARHAPDPLGPMPPNLTYVTDGCGGKRRYLRAVLARRSAWAGAGLIVCGHVNLLPVAWAIKRRTGAPILLVIYGIDAWQPAGGFLLRRALRHVDAVVSISELTRARFLSWAPVARERCVVVPNAVRIERYADGRGAARVRARHGLEGKRVMLTVGRIVSGERGKGFDEVLAAMPALRAQDPDLAYLVVGEGDDLPRLRRVAERLGVAGSVVFAGYVPEEEKAAYFRSADAYVMPSRGEGFGFVFLEALASGLPVVASRVDGGREALRDGALGILVDPDSPEEVAAGIRRALATPRGVPPGLGHFSLAAFEGRINRVVDHLLAASAGRAA
jgi:asparagine synthase (glutamine-hydrolysing)